ncbi:hypothetical protein [Bacillus cereus]|uniref:hypothetical protein n=1 Tax=Bacillus cereus TaxID=1396 RepID=UPI0009B55D71|nr:hypothetical protein [Bacillus cereus]
MTINKEDIINICKTHGTPMYLYDGEMLREKFFSITNRIGNDVDIFLSLKANSNVSIASLFANWGAGVEVASLGEMNIALKAGFSVDNIIFSGPGKRIEELKTAIQHKIYCIIAESKQEIYAIMELAKQLNQKVRVGIRINPDQDIARAKIKMAGIPRQFGIDESQVEDVIVTIKKSKYLKFVGIHIYTGTQNLNIDSIIDTFNYTLGLAKKIKQKYKIDLEMVNLGGGLGIAYFSQENDLNFDILMNKIKDLITDAKKELSNTRFIIESGRYLLAESGTYITSVLYTKESKGENFAITDGGLNHHQACTFRGRMIRSNYPVITIRGNNIEERTANKEKITIVGPLCTPEDIICKDALLPKIFQHDYICILKSGAYGLSYSPQNFLGHPSPIEVLLMGTKEYVIRNRGNYNDVLSNQNMVNWEKENEF